MALDQLTAPELRALKMMAQNWLPHHDHLSVLKSQIVLKH